MSQPSSRSKYFLFITLIATLRVYPLAAQQSDSSKQAIEKAIVAAGWLQYWQGVPNQWMDIQGGRAEVTGYVTVDKRLCFFKDHTFEMDIYREPPYYSVTPIELNNYNPCRGRKDGELSVITGSWSVKRDSIYVVYKTENFYDYEQYADYQGLKRSGETNLTRPRSKGRCKLSRKEIYLWQDGKVCMAAATDICYK
ncbi:MAG: hypothetical protein V4649_01915 [Bacteroidota bacterium]